jgi:acyl-CoA synthetase (AMP-forming)/AMP-acid ligase II/acyl carrier protein
MKTYPDESTAQTHVVQTITTFFFRQVKQSPQALAVIDAQASITYEQLAGLAGGVARKIVKKTGSDAARICILAAQNIYAVAGMLGVLMSGKCFVPMLPQENDNYLRYLWENSEASLIVCSPQEATRAASICGDSARVIICEVVSGEADVFDLSGYEQNLDNLSAIMYTSGTTGQPKGVMTTGSAIFNRALQHVEMAYVTSNDRQASVVPWQFAASFPDIFASLITGATLYMYDNHRLGIERLGLWLKEHSITLLKLPSALLRRFVENVSADLLRYVRYVYVSGGAVKVEEARLLLNVLPVNAILMHGFGSTETNLLAKAEWRRTDAVFQASYGEDVLPAGYPVADKKIQIVDEEKKHLVLGQVGELAVISRDIFLGYWKQPKMTQQCLKELPTGERVYYTGDLGKIREDGCLEIVGRKGSRVKIRGLRIDLNAVETQLRSLSYIRDVAVIPFSATGREAQLVAYLETIGEEPPTITMIRNDLMKIAPRYMIPSRFVLIEFLPRKASGKVDRSSLPPPGRQRPKLDNPYAPPRTPLEYRLADIWADVLEIEEVGINDNFSDLGGDSLLVLEMEMMLEQEFGEGESIARLLQAPTIAQMAAMIEDPLASFEESLDSLRELPLRFRNFLKEIKRRIIEYAPRLISISPSYESFLRLHEFWLSLPLAQFLYRRKINVFRQWLELTGQADENGLLSYRNLLVNTWFVAREFILAQKKSYDKALTITGWENVQSAREKGKGVILVFPHMRVLFPCIRKYLSQKIFSEYFFLNINRTPRSENLKMIMMMQRIKEAHGILKSGNAVWVAGDGLTGTIRVTLKKYGRNFPFRSGAADLAIKTGAPMILVFPAMKAKGMMEVEFLKPLLPKANGSVVELVDDLTRQYAEIYVARWSQMLPNMTSLWQRMRLKDD